MFEELLIKEILKQIKPLYFYRFRFHKRIGFYKDIKESSPVNYWRFLFFELLRIDFLKTEPWNN